MRNVILGLGIFVFLQAPPALLACSGTTQQKQQNINTAESVAEKIACAIAKAESPDPAINAACDIAPEVLPLITPALTVHRLALTENRKALTAPCGSDTGK